jgi:DNA (cytosine-5)-methyltransferase 1
VGADAGAPVDPAVIRSGTLAQHPVGVVTRPRLLDLFCGAGGAGMGYHRAGFDVVGVDINPQPNYPFEFVQADAMTYPLDGFDAIHASPPCQAFTAYRNTGKVGDYPDLIDPCRQRLTATGVPWVMENVAGSPLRATLMLCGTMFDPVQPIQRHRYFESNVAMWAPNDCRHHLNPPNRYPGGRSKVDHGDSRALCRATIEVGAWRIPLAEQKAAMGIDWMTLPELSESIPPAYTEWIGRQLVAVLAVAS